MKRYRAFALITLLAVGLALAWPLSRALSPVDIRTTRVVAIVVSILLCTGAALVRSGIAAKRRLWLGFAGLAFATGLALSLVQFSATGSCVAHYGAKPKLIGMVLQPYVQPEPGQGADSLLFDAAGVPESVWTPASIRTCRWMLGWPAMLAVPLFALAACCAVQGSRHTLIGTAHSRPSGPPAPAGAIKYDFFASYRHIEPDRSLALELFERLEESGFRGAIDARDFAANQNFLSEMERCIKESRYVLCLITSRYIDSDHCVEEAVISKTFDLSQRTRRIVPLIYESVQLPVWLHGISGVNFTDNAVVDPFDRLRELLAQR